MTRVSIASLVLCVGVLLLHGGERSHAEQAACTTTVNADRTSLSAALTAASDGDVICLNAGTVEYTSHLSITKAVEIRGAGTVGTARGATTSGGTTIRSNSATAVFGLDATTAGHIILSNLTFTYDATSASLSSGVLVLNRSTPTGDASVIRNCTFTVTGRNDQPKLIVVAEPSALIFRNVFTAERLAPSYVNTNVIPVFVALSDDGSSWGSTHTMGSADTTGVANVYVEDNDFDGFNVSLDANTSARVVWRYNEMHNASLGGHGYDSSAYGNRHVEIYGNRFICDGVINLSNWISRRGGTGYIHNNTFASGNGDLCDYGEAGDFSAIQFSQYKLQQCEEIGGWPGLYSDTYPAAHQVGWGWISGSNQAVGESSAENDPGGSGFQQALEPIYIANNVNNTPALVNVATGYVGTCRAMAHAVTGKATGATLVLGGYASTGQHAVVVFADLVGGTTPTIADSGGHTWSPLQAGTTGDMRLSAWHTRVTTGGQLTVTVTFQSSSAARTGVLAYLRELTTTPLDANPSVAVDNTSPHDAPSTGTLAQSDEVVLGYFALNGPTTYAYSGFTGDAIDVASPDLRAISGPTASTVGIIGTTGGAADTNVTVALTYRYVTATTAVQPRITNATANRTGLVGSVSFKNTGTNPDLQTTDFIQANREYYETSAGTSLPGTCTTGQGYWVTNEGEWNTARSGVDGRFYRCTSTNTWSLWYAPFVYPHPLRDVPAAPTNVRE